MLPAILPVSVCIIWTLSKLVLVNGHFLFTHFPSEIGKHMLEIQEIILNYQGH